MGGRRLLLAARRRFVIPFLIQISRVLIVVTVETQQLPVATVGRIVIVVVVLMMDRELAKFLALKIAPAPRTDPGIDLERLLPITLLPLLPVAPGLGYNPVESVFV